MVAVRVGVDDPDHRLARQFLDLVEDGLAPPRVLRVDHRDAVRPDEHGRVAAATLQDEQVVLELLDLDNLGRRGRLVGRHRQRQATDREESTKQQNSFHASPPGKNTR